MNDAAVADSADALTCSACEYDLRGLDRTGVCPECGQSIEQSRRAEHDRPAHLRWLSFGSLLLAISMYVGGVGAAFDARSRVDLAWWFPLAAVIGGVGTWILATPARFRDRRLCGFVRLLAIITPTVQCVIWIGSQTPGIGRIPVELIGRMIQVTAAIWALAAVGTFTRAAIIAYEIDDSMGKVQARVLSVVVPALLVLIALCASRFLIAPLVMPLMIGVIISIFAITGWSGIFFSGFAITLWRSSRRLERAIKEQS